MQDSSSSITIRRYFITGSQRLSNFFWASLIFLGGAGFLLTGFSSFLNRGTFPVDFGVPEVPKTIDFVEQSVSAFGIREQGLSFLKEQNKDEMGLNLRTFLNQGTNDTRFYDLVLGAPIQNKVSPCPVGTKGTYVPIRKTPKPTFAPFVPVPLRGIQGHSKAKQSEPMSLYPVGVFRDKGHVTGFKNQGSSYTNESFLPLMPLNTVASVACITYKTTFLCPFTPTGYLGAKQGSVQNVVSATRTYANNSIKFFPQGLIMCFYGCSALIFSLYLWLTILWKVGNGFNEFNKETGVVRIFRWGLPGKDRQIDFSYSLKDIEALRVTLKEGINPRRTIALQIKGKGEIPLTRIGEPMALQDIENQASELANFLKIEIQVLNKS